MNETFFSFAKIEVIASIVIVDSMLVQNRCCEKYFCFNFFFFFLRI